MNGESFKSDNFDEKSDDEIINILYENRIKIYNIEKHISNFQRCVEIRRKFLEIHKNVEIDIDLPYAKFDYSKVFQRCCENVIGYVTIPVGISGPINLNCHLYYVPLATTEGCLVASTTRGASCVVSSGIQGIIVDDGMTRAPIIRTDSAITALKIKNWLKDDINFNLIKKAFDGTSNFAKLKEISCTIAGRYVYLRFKATTGDAMGMNMVSKGVEVSLSVLLDAFRETTELTSLSGNLCCDKKPSAINWIDGRGKSVVCEAFIHQDVIKSILNVTPQQLVELNISKNLVGSALAGSIGGNNANSANIVAAIFTATGQDIAQVVGSSNCLTYMEMIDECLYISCTMPCLEVATIGGGTMLPSQRACLNMIHLEQNSNISTSCNLALVTCATVLCCELSLMAALSNGKLVSSHMRFNRCKKGTITCMPS